MPSYSFRFRKADHIRSDGKADLHVHAYFNHAHSRKPLGRYRIPTLEPVFPDEPELNNTEMRALREWLSLPEQQRKLQDALEDTLFDMDKVARLAPTFATVVKDDKDGDTYLTVRIPVTRRLP
jgi:hypothetical protein